MKKPISMRRAGPSVALILWALGTVAATDATVATSADVTLALTMSVAVATDHSIIEEYSVYTLTSN